MIAKQGDQYKGVDIDKLAQDFIKSTALPLVTVSEDIGNLNRQSRCLGYKIPLALPFIQGKRQGGFIFLRKILTNVIFRITI